MEQERIVFHQKLFCIILFYFHYFYVLFWYKLKQSNGLLEKRALSKVVKDVNKRGKEKLVKGVKDMT